MKKEKKPKTTNVLVLKPKEIKKQEISKQIVIRSEFGIRLTGCILLAGTPI